MSFMCFVEPSFRRFWLLDNKKLFWKREVTTIVDIFLLHDTFMAHQRSGPLHTCGTHWSRRQIPILGSYPTAGNTKGKKLYFYLEWTTLHSSPQRKSAVSDPSLTLFQPYPILRLQPIPPRHIIIKTFTLHTPSKKEKKRKKNSLLIILILILFI